MSASREKKQRQDIPEHKLTQKQRKEQEEAQARRRKTIIYTIVGVILAILVAALLIWHSGFFQSRTTAMTVGDRNYTPTDVAYYYHQALNTEYMYGQMLGSSNFDPSVDPKEQYTNCLLYTSTGDSLVGGLHSHGGEFHEGVGAIQGAGGSPAAGLELCGVCLLYTSRCV